MKQWWRWWAAWLVVIVFGNAFIAIVWSPRGWAAFGAGAAIGVVAYASGDYWKRRAV